MKSSFEVVFWELIEFALFILFLLCLGFIPLLETENGNISVKQEIRWDYSNPEVKVSEYSIMGVSGNELVIEVSWNEEKTLRTIPLDSLKIEYSEDVLIPYVYRENYIYTEYDYSKNPPEVLRKDTETWMEYKLRGSKSQIQDLFGYDGVNFEQ